MSFIDQATVDRIFSTARIEDVVGDYVKLKKRGVNYLGLCPFHNEKTPSFIVSPAKGICKCFGCGKGGNAVNFIMELEKVSYAEALRHLAKRYRIDVAEQELTPEQNAQRDKRESLMAANAFAAEFFVRQMADTDEGKSVGMGYFRQRGFRDDIIARFGLGYSPKQGDALAKAAQAAGFRSEFFTTSGLLGEKDGRIYDRFRERVIFPILGVSGRIIAFGGRLLSSEKTAAKYINSSENELYSKSNVLYGLFYARTAIAKLDVCYLVEGYTDVISMHQCGLENTVASAGTSLTPDQLRLIKRFTSNLTIIYDGDKAGINASMRGINLALEQEFSVRVLLLPDGNDPDSFARSHSAEEFTDYIKKHEEDFLSFQARQLMQTAGNDPFKKAAAVNEIIESIARIPDPVVRAAYSERLSELMQIDQATLRNQANQFAKRRAKEPALKQPGTLAPRTQPPTRIEPSPRTEPRPEPRPEHPPLPDDPSLPPIPQEPGDEQGEGPIFASELDIIQEHPLESPYWHNEYEILRLLMLYGTYPLYSLPGQPEPQIVPVFEFVFQEITIAGIEFESPLLKKAYTAYYHAISEGAEEPASRLVQSPDRELSRLACDLLSTQEQLHLSRIWRRKEAYVETEDMTLFKLTPETIVDYKRTRVNREIELLSGQLRSAKDNEQVMSIMTRLHELQKYKQVLSKDINRIF